MIHSHGAVETARRLVMSGDMQDGFLRLLKLGHSELTIEQGRHISVRDSLGLECTYWN